MQQFALVERSGFVLAYYESPETPLRLCVGTDLQVLDICNGFIDVTPRAGDIGEPIRHIELEPVEAPISVPHPVTVPDREPVPA